MSDFQVKYPIALYKLCGAYQGAVIRKLFRPTGSVSMMRILVVKNHLKTWETRIKIEKKNHQNRVVCPNFGHPALTSSLTKVISTFITILNGPSVL